MWPRDGLELSSPLHHLPLLRVSVPLEETQVFLLVGLPHTSGPRIGSSVGFLYPAPQPASQGLVSGDVSFFKILEQREGQLRGSPEPSPGPQDGKPWGSRFSGASSGKSLVPSLSAAPISTLHTSMNTGSASHCPLFSSFNTRVSSPSYR